jgi:hypothetical protein
MNCPKCGAPKVMNEQMEHECRCSMNARLWEAYEPPFSCDNESPVILDKNGEIIITVRGWSRLSSLFNHDDAFQLQLDIAAFISDKLNELHLKEDNRATRT